MVVIDRVVAMAVQGPKQIFLKPVTMAVIGDHPGVLLQRLGDARDM